MFTRNERLVDRFIVRGKTFASTLRTHGQTRDPEEEEEEEEVRSNAHLCSYLLHRLNKNLMLEIFNASLSPLFVIYCYNHVEMRVEGAAVTLPPYTSWKPGAPRRLNINPDSG